MAPLFFEMSSLILGDKEFRTFAHVERLGAEQNLLQSECICQDLEEAESRERRGVGVSQNSTAVFSFLIQTMV